MQPRLSREGFVLGAKMLGKDRLADLPPDPGELVALHGIDSWCEVARRASR